MIIIKKINSNFVVKLIIAAVTFILIGLIVYGVIRSLKTPTDDSDTTKNIVVESTLIIDEKTDIVQPPSITDKTNVDKEQPVASEEADISFDINNYTHSLEPSVDNVEIEYGTKEDWNEEE